MKYSITILATLIYSGSTDISYGQNIKKHTLLLDAFGVESIYENLKGVKEVYSGYSGGSVTYYQVIW